MSGKIIRAKVFRFDPAVDKEPYYQSYEVPLEKSMSALGEKRSVSAPPTSMKRARGMAARARTVPIASGLPVSFSTSQGRAIR